jgi:hypothetical protein
MGLLDDAIREHLELKRRHGADPEEVARQENEALGETRRAEFARPEGAEAPVEPAAEEPATAEEEPVLEEAAAPEAEDDVPEFMPVREREPEPEPAPEPAAHEPAAHEPFDVEAEEPVAQPAPVDPEPPQGDPWLDEDPDEVPADDALDHPRTAEEPPPPAKSEDGEDVLEETPDFLQETPEHDRLWFEQRPPRDFDWDK